MKKITKLLLALPLSLCLSLGTSTPLVHATYAKTTQKTNKNVKVGSVSKLKSKVVRSNKKNAKIT